jgi:phosphopentomutase
MSRVIILVADGVGCGGAPDAAAYGNTGADTLGNLSRRVGGLALPHLAGLGLGHTTAIQGVPPVASPRGAWGMLTQASAGKDTITGHWEMAGLVTTEPMATFPNGFPDEIIEELTRAAGRKLIGNKPASGTAIIEELGAEHLKTGALILYTSGDSVLQIAAHEEIVALPELYRICRAARGIADRHRIGRVIARPFVGGLGPAQVAGTARFRRTYNRSDFAMMPPEPTLCDILTAAGIPVVGVGKISDIFAGRGVPTSLHTEGNDDGMRVTLQALDGMNGGLLFVNLIDFDMVYGHRNDCPGFARALAAFDAWLPHLESHLRTGDVVFITADHGNDPTTPGSDHTRERVPLLAFGPGTRPATVGIRSSFCDLGQTVASALKAPPLARGVGFWDQIRASGPA